MGWSRESQGARAGVAIEVRSPLLNVIVFGKCSRLKLPGKDLMWDSIFAQGKVRIKQEKEHQGLGTVAARSWGGGSMSCNWKFL